MPDGKLLNAAFLADRLRSLGLKQWWIAEQIGVDRKTVGRWLRGQVKRIQPENLEHLARCIGCKPKDLTLADSADALATRAEQIEAAHLIAKESLIETLGPLGQWSVLESLIRATMRPDLPLSTLGRLYNQLSIAAWRQSNLERGENYATKALEIGRRCRSSAVIAAATLNLATLASFRGRLSDSLALYKECMKLSRFLEDEVTHAKAMSNYGAVYLDAGDFKTAIKWQKQAIRRFRRLRRPTNESIAWVGLANAFAEGGDLDRAWKASENAELLASQANYRRGICDAGLVKAELLATQHRTKQAAAVLGRARTEFNRLDIREPRVEAVAALIARLDGRLQDAGRHLAAGLKLARNFPVDRARLLAERAALARATGCNREAARVDARRTTLLKSMWGEF